jgi:acyl-CoA synthetase (AMP-forming)/AMP-acid ligase II
MQPDPDEFIRAAMRWHFSTDTGSPFWLAQRGKLGFDPIAEVRSFADLCLFPNVAAELREVRAEDLIPRGYGPRPDVVGVFESGGTTGAPKRLVLLRDWLDKLMAWISAQLDAHGVPRDVNWLLAVPSGPHMTGEIFLRLASARGGLPFMVDMDPRWVKKLIASGHSADAYAEHLVDQIGNTLRSQDITFLALTPPLLERLVRRDDVAALIRGKVKAIMWGGTQMDPAVRRGYRTEVFPGTVLYSAFGNTMMLAITSERPGLGDDEPCVYDTFSPYVSLGVIDPGSGAPVAYGARGQIVTHHVSRALLLPNNLERDYGTRVEPLPGQVGDSVADVSPMKEFDNHLVIEGVY